MKKRTSKLKSPDLMSIETESSEIGSNVFKIDGLLNLIESFLDKKSYMQFINIKKEIHDKINRRIFINTLPTEKETKILSNIKNIIQIKFKGNFDHCQILKKMKADKITKLEIDGNKITDCSFISSLPNLKIFSIKSAKIDDCNFIKTIKRLEELHVYFRPCPGNIYENKYYDEGNLLINSIKDLKNLKALDLSYMVFDDISGLPSLSLLEKLNLSYCHVKNDFSVLKQLTKLKYLNLCNSNVANIDFLANLNALTELNIASCADIVNFQAISNLGKLKSLTMSWIRYNKDSKEIDLSFLECLTELEYLNIGHNKTENYEIIGFNKELKTLIIDDNKLEDISFLEDLKNLKILSISSNVKIKDYRCISKLYKLEKLYISNNNLHDIKFISDLTNLNELYLSDNEEVIDGDLKLLQKLGNIKKINLKRTSFGKDTSILSKLKHLERVIVNRNQLSEGQVSTLEGRHVHVNFC